MTVLYFLEGIRNSFLDSFFSFITLFGEETVFMVVGMMVFWCVDKFQGYYLLCTGFIGTVINQFLKMLFRVPRPWIKDPNFTIVETARDAATGYSFPSGHTQSSVGIFGGIARWNKNKITRIVCITLCVLVPLSRMYLGVHTVYDVAVSAIIATVLIFILYPIFEKCKECPKYMYILLSVFTAVMIGYLCFIEFHNFPQEVYSETNISNYISARKNAYTLLGCVLGLIVVYTLDLKYIKFTTKAVWWVQIIKTVGGIGLVLIVKEGMKSPLEVVFVNEFIARGVRYFLVVIMGGVIWPLTFKYFSKIK